VLTHWKAALVDLFFSGNATVYGLGHFGSSTWKSDLR